MSSVEEATCTVSAVDATTGGATYDIQFKSWNDDIENNLYTHDGPPFLNIEALSSH
jgi:hypothetical protein